MTQSKPTILSYHWNGSKNPRYCDITSATQMASATEDARDNIPGDAAIGQLALNGKSNQLFDTFAKKECVTWENMALASDVLYLSWLSSLWFDLHTRDRLWLKRALDVFNLKGGLPDDFNEAARDLTEKYGGLPEGFLQ